MSFKKNWTATGDKEIVRVERYKPGIGSNDQLDEINEQFAEHERACHEAGECLEECPHCEADAEAEHYQRSTFDRLNDIFQGTPIINPWTKVKP